MTPIPLENLKEEPAPLLNIDFASEVLSDDEDEDFLPTPYLKAGSNISKSQRSSHVHVYTHNVNSLIFFLRTLDLRNYHWMTKIRCFLT